MILKTLLSTLAQPDRIKVNKNELNIDSDNGSIDNNKIDYKIANLSSNTKKISSKASFLTSKANLIFIQFTKILTKAMIPILF